MAVTTTMALPAGGVFALWQAVLAWMGGLHFLMLLVTAIPQVMGRSGLALSARQMVFFSPRYAKMRTGMLAVGSMYAALTAAGAVIYFFSGLTPMQSVSWAMQTISTTGGTMPFERAMDVSSVAGSGHAGIWLGRGLLEVNESALEIATVVILLLGGGNFLLYWKSITMKSFGMLIHDTELRAFLSMIVGVGLLISLFLRAASVHDAGVCGWVHRVNDGRAQDHARSGAVEVSRAGDAHDDASKAGACCARGWHACSR